MGRKAFQPSRDPNANDARDPSDTRRDPNARAAQNGWPGAHYEVSGPEKSHRPTEGADRLRIPYLPWGREARPEFDAIGGTQVEDPQTPAPSGITTICAALLAALGSLAHLLGAACFFVIALIPPRVNCDAPPCPQPAYPPYLAVTAGIGILLLSIGGLLGVGASRLFRRRPEGRRLVLLGCALVLVSHLIGLAIVAILINTGDITDSDAVDFSVTAAIALVFPIVTLMLTLAPATARWLALSSR